MKKYKSILLVMVMISSFYSGCGDRSFSDTSSSVLTEHSMTGSSVSDDVEHIHASGKLDEYWVSEDCFDLMGYMKDNGYTGSIDRDEWNDHTKVTFFEFEKDEWTIDFLKGKMCFIQCHDGLTTTYTFVLKDKLLKESRDVSIYGSDVSCKYHDLKALNKLVDNINITEYPSDGFEEYGTAERASF